RHATPCSDAHNVGHRAKNEGRRKLGYWILPEPERSGHFVRRPTAASVPRHASWIILISSGCRTRRTNIITAYVAMPVTIGTAMNISLTGQHEATITPPAQKMRNAVLALAQLSVPRVMRYNATIAMMNSVHASRSAPPIAPLPNMLWVQETKTKL